MSENNNESNKNEEKDDHEAGAAALANDPILFTEKTVANIKKLQENVATVWVGNYQVLK